MVYITYYIIYSFTLISTILPIVALDSALQVLFETFVFLTAAYRFTLANRDLPFPPIKSPSSFSQSD